MRSKTTITYQHTFMSHNTMTIAFLQLSCGQAVLLDDTATCVLLAMVQEFVMAESSSAWISAAIAARLAKSAERALPQQSQQLRGCVGRPAALTSAHAQVYRALAEHADLLQQPERDIVQLLIVWTESLLGTDVTDALDTLQAWLAVLLCRLT